MEEELDLEALFDSVATHSGVADAAVAQTQAASPAIDAAVVEGIADHADQFFGDEGAAAASEPTMLADDGQMDMAAAMASMASGSNPPAIFEGLGQVARSLHTSLKEMGYDKTLGSLVEDGIPDVRSRLNYITQKTEDAANRTIEAAEKSQKLEMAIESGAGALIRRWKAFLTNPSSQDEFKSLMQDNLKYLEETHSSAGEVGSMLTTIVMAQDYQDLTGQVIRKVVDTAEQVEAQLVSLLIATAPPEKKERLGADLMQGPVINGSGGGDVLTSQEQVDDLLASLGF